MDLTPIETWTRDTLENEARRIGIKGCEYRTRTELVRLILRDRYGETWNAGRERIARGVRSLNEARALLGVTIERTIATVLGMPEPLEFARRGARVHAREWSVAPPEASHAAWQSAQAAVTHSGAAEPDAAPMTRASEDDVDSIGANERAAVVRWRATAAGIRRARAVLGADGEIAVRVVVVAPDPDTFVRTSVVDHGPVDATGELPTPPRVEGARTLAAVGLRAGPRFVAIAHARL